MKRKNLWGATLMLALLHGQLGAKESIVKTYLTGFENRTVWSDFKVFVADAERFLLAHDSSIDLSSNKELKESILVSGPVRINVISLEGLPSIYLQFGGWASGECGRGESGPYYITMWQGLPDADDKDKVVVRYCQKGDKGTLGLRIDQNGEPELVAEKDTVIIE